MSETMISVGRADVLDSREDEGRTQRPHLIDAQLHRLALKRAGTS